MNSFEVGCYSKPVRRHTCIVCGVTQTNKSVLCTFSALVYGPTGKSSANPLLNCYQHFGTHVVTVIMMIVYVFSVLVYDPTRISSANHSLLL